MRLITSRAALPVAALPAALLLSAPVWGGIMPLPTVYDLPACPTGTRSVSLGTLLAADPGWSEASISWTVVPNPDGTLRYTYTLAGFTSSGVSHFTLDLTDSAALDPLSITSPTLNGHPIPFSIGDKDGIVGAVKLDAGAGGTLVYSFDSNRAPVWGHFFVQGESGFGTNVAFGDQTSPDKLDYIARPNGSIPEPVMAGLLAVPLLLLMRRH